MNISYFQSPALTFVLCTSLLFQICKPIVTQKPLHSHASSSALCKASSVVPSQLPVGTRCLQSLHHTEQSQPRCQSLNGPSARATPSPPTEINPGQDGGEAAWVCRAATLVPSRTIRASYVNWGLRSPGLLLWHLAQRLMPFKKLGSRKQTGIG